MKKDRYVLGTGLSHDGSACLLKNGKICVAIEKERITRIKHDGGNDLQAVNYCLNQAGITINDIDLIVQQSLFGNFLKGNAYYDGPRVIPETNDIPVITISHHLAHAYYAIGTCQFEDTAVIVLDGAGSFYHECIDLGTGTSGEKNLSKEIEHLYLEKDSLYLYQNKKLTTVYKDFSPLGRRERRYPMCSDINLHSIGGIYGVGALYCFGNLFDTGKLMGLAPYGRPDIYKIPIFDLREGRVFVIYDDWFKEFLKPVLRKDDLYDNFQYYADIAFWIQKETERAIEYLIGSRRKLVTVENLCYTGGVALNAVANALLLKKRPFDNIYFPPAAGDNGIAIGCAYYGWLEVLNGDRAKHNGNSCFGKTYPDLEIENELYHFIKPGKKNHKLFIDAFFSSLPSFLRANIIIKEKYAIKFIIEGMGTYSVLFEPPNIALVGDGNNDIQHDCILFTDTSDFVSSIFNREQLRSSLMQRKAFLKGDASTFLELVDFPSLYIHVLRLAKEDPAYEPLYFEKSKDVVASAAGLLAQGKIIAWFQGGSEFGPRALGNRSILADPRKKGIKQFINSKIKFREDFRPFAPAIMREHVSEYFDFNDESPYMILVAQVRPEWKDKISDVVHVDSSSRIQTVTAQSNGKFYQLLKAFKEITGIPILLNTSFNRKSMPIIEKPAEALSFFFECELDYLIIDNYIVSKDKPCIV